MPFKEDFQPGGSEDGGVQSIEAALDQIDHILHQMLLLSELSASTVNVDRERLQRVLERLQEKIDRIADTI